MDKSKAHSMSIDDILVSVRNVINEKDNIDPDDSSFDELELTDIKDEASKESILSEDAKEQNRQILKDFVNNAKNVQSQMQEAKKSTQNIPESIIRSEIKSWLDANLPAIVKQIVSEEVKKLVADVNEVLK